MRKGREQVGRSNAKKKGCTERGKGLEGGIGTCSPREGARREAERSKTGIKLEKP